MERTSKMRAKKPIEEFFSEKIDVNEDGGGQSRVNFRFDLLDPYAMFKLAEVAKHGAERYAVDNWRKIDCDTHLNHGIGHIYEYLKNRDIKALSHAFCRLMMAVATAEEAQDAQNVVPDLRLVGEAKFNRD